MRSARMLAVVVLALGLAGSASAGWTTAGNNMYADVSGNIGIGTMQPEHKLHVSGLARFDLPGGSINISTPGGWPGLIMFCQNGHRRDFIVCDDGLRIEAGPSASAPPSGNGIFIAENGNVGIKAKPGFTLHVNGSAGKPGGGSWSNTSDARLKTNIGPLEAPLEQLLQLRGVTFEFISPQEINELPGVQMGMVAQDVETVFPQWVDTNAAGFKTVTFRGFEALTVEAIRQLCQEKDAQIARLEEQISQLTARLERMEAGAADRPWDAGR